MNKLFFRTLILILTVSICTACKKLVEVRDPINTITTSQTFSSDATATAAVIAIYSDMSWGQGGLNFATGGLTRLCALSADELKTYGEDQQQLAFQNNDIPSDNGSINGVYWTPVYGIIYKCNAVLDGLQASGTISSDTKEKLTGEAKFLRAYCYFYLVNLFGEVPLLTTPAWAESAMQARNDVAEIYEQIFDDLKDAQTLLPAESTDKTRANKWAASALLARAYLYQQQWDNAVTEATAVIAESSFGLEPDLNNVFLKDNREAIFQLSVIDHEPYATREGNLCLPFDSVSSPVDYISSELLGSFEPNDRRRNEWVDSTFYQDQFFFFPFKYKIRQGVENDIRESYTLLRLSEQYLIRAEAYAQKNALTEAIADLNVIRTRAGLPELPASLSQTEVLAAVEQENRVEFFAEWGHRWLDLKRTGQANTVLAPLKPDWNTNDELYPIPQAELRVNPNLVQNPGY